MTPSRPYLIRGLFDWILDNQCTPYIVVNAEVEGVDVPEDYVEDGRIILNISPSATQNLLLQNESISFAARFKGRSVSVFLPQQSIVAIYPKEMPQYMWVLPSDVDMSAQVYDPNDLSQLEYDFSKSPTQWPNTDKSSETSENNNPEETIKDSQIQSGIKRIKTQLDLVEVKSDFNDTPPTNGEQNKASKKSKRPTLKIIK